MATIITIIRSGRSVRRQRLVTERLLDSRLALPLPPFPLPPEPGRLLRLLPAARASSASASMASSCDATARSVTTSEPARHNRATQTWASARMLGRTSERHKNTDPQARRSVGWRIERRRDGDLGRRRRRHRRQTAHPPVIDAPPTRAARPSSARQSPPPVRTITAGTLGRMERRWWTLGRVELRYQR